MLSLSHNPSVDTSDELTMNQLDTIMPPTFEDASRLAVVEVGWRSALFRVGCCGVLHAYKPLPPSSQDTVLVIRSPSTAFVQSHCFSSADTILEFGGAISHKVAFQLCHCALL